MAYMYEKTATPRDGLRLHLNESTLGCSPAVIEAVRGLTAQEMALYPDYSEAIGACASYLAVREDEVLLTNGLDEGILAVSLHALRGAGAAEPHEAIVIVPAFDMFAASADAAGGRVVEVPLRENFGFPLEEVLAAINSRTRLVFVNDPHNPTGQSVPPGCIQAIASAARPAIVFVDEAYIEFRDDPVLNRSLFQTYPNVVIGRTFAKAHGLAAIRAGALVGHPETLEAIRRGIPPYSLNVAAAVALPAALRDRDHLARYLRHVHGSRELIYHAFTRLGVPYWRSDANFVLARFGDRSAAVLGALRERHIHVRDRSGAPGCAGCLRITTGVLPHTERAIQAIEEVLCGAR
jgi:histidinol-phosphate aminotransferase